MANLYILGNGFDLHHGFKTSYGHFKEYVHSNHAEYLPKINEFEKKNLFKYPLGENWCDIEYALKLEVQFIRKEEDQQEIYSTLITVFRDFFNEWISGINKRIKTSGDEFADLNLSKNDFYFTFNFTNTLENVYGISRFLQQDYPKKYQPEISRIIHIHMPVQEIDDDALKDLSHQINPYVFGNKENAKAYEKEPQTPYKDFLLNFKKDVKGEFAFHYNRSIKCWLGEKFIDSIRVYGHSLDFENEGSESEINLTNDGYYFYQIKNLFPNANWIFYYHNQENILSEIKAIKTLNLNPKKCSIRPENELFKDSVAYLQFSAKENIDYQIANALYQQEKSKEIK